MLNGYRIYDLNNASPAAKPVLEEVQRHYQFIPNALSAMAESPEAVRAYMMLDEINSENSLTDEERHVAFLAISREYNCQYCVAAHTAFAQMGQVDGGFITGLRESKPLANKKLNALQTFVGQLVESDGYVNEKDFNTFLAAGYTRQTALEVITMIANKMIAILANRVMGTDLDAALEGARWSRDA